MKIQTRANGFHVGFWAKQTWNLLQYLHIDVASITIYTFNHYEVQLCTFMTYTFWISFITFSKGEGVLHVMTLTYTNFCFN